MLGSIRTLADRLIGLSAYVGALGLIVEVVVILVDVIGRALGSPLYGSQDITTMAMVILVFGGMAICDRNNGHISVDLFEKYYPPALNRFIDIVSAIVGALVFVAIAYAVNESAKISVMLNLSTNLLRLPKFVFQNALSILALLTAGGMALRAIEMIFSGRNVHSENKI